MQREQAVNLGDSGYSGQMEVNAPKGKFIPITLNMLIVILTIWYLIIFGMSFVDHKQV